MATLLQKVRDRQKRAQKGFHYGIGTAFHYVKSVRECVGSDICYQYAASKETSFEDVLRKASKTLVYGKSDMGVDEVLFERKATELKNLEGIELPKNTLMVFSHKLTSPKKDRDGDILRSEGGSLDPNMLLLWQHVPTLPIGKYLKTTQHDSSCVKAVSCIVDMNQLAHDAAVMVDNKMGRFSHGFRALEYAELRDTSGHWAGFDVKKFEVLEESLVSIPSNTDAVTEEVILSLVEGGKMKSALMKEYGKTIRSKRNTTVYFPEGAPDGKQRKETCGCGGKSSPAKTKAGAAGQEQTDGGTEAAAQLEHKEVEFVFGKDTVLDSIQNIIIHADDTQKDHVIEVLTALKRVDNFNQQAGLLEALL